jgi:hypothetical protein
LLVPKKEDYSGEEGRFEDLIRLGLNAVFVGGNWSDLNVFEQLVKRINTSVLLTPSTFLFINDFQRSTSMRSKPKKNKRQNVAALHQST